MRGQMEMLRRIVRGLLGGLVVLSIAVAVTGGWWWYAEQQAAEARALRASGRLEATEVKLSSERGGRLAGRPVRDGDQVRRGRDAWRVAVFDTDLLDHQIQMADLATRVHLERERERQTLRATLDGWVIRTVFDPGEQVPPGAPVVVIGDWREVTLKVYLPEDRFGRVSLEQAADVTVDAYPGEVFPGTVTWIASEAEFTPRNVQTQEDRVKSVYAIRLRVPNADLRLKPGMFADATFASESGDRNSR
ncbi:MAG: efflux RND transporter periplasmic adaptor subunit [Chloroflexi bacterium]|nr:efflux RND transporter periplasmic adaptor subunit [Chloroflexota bacterium]